MSIQILCPHTNAYWTEHTIVRYNHAHEKVECPDCGCRWTVNTRIDEHTCQSEDEYIQKIKEQQSADTPKEDLKRDTEPQLTMSYIKSARLQETHPYCGTKPMQTIFKMSLTLSCISDDGAEYEVLIPEIDLSDMKLNITVDQFNKDGLAVEKKEASLNIPVKPDRDSNIFIVRKVMTQADIEAQLGYKVHIEG